MASVHKRKGSKYYRIHYRVGGKQRAVSTHTEDRYEALQIAAQIDGLKVNYTREKALRLVDEIARVVDSENRAHEITVAEHMADWFALHKSKWSESTTTNYAAIHRQFKQAAGTVPLGLLDIQHFVAYRNALAGKNRSHETIRQHIVHLRDVFQAAHEEKLILKNYANEVRTNVGRPSEGRTPFTLQQFSNLLHSTTGEWHLLILLAGLTGQRAGDCLDLSYDSISGDYITFNRQKNRDDHIVPIHPLLATALQGHTSGPVLPNMSKWPRSGYRGVSHKFRDTILPLIGIKQKRTQGAGGNKKIAPYSFHSLRHMLSTELESSGASPEIRMLIVGHDNPSVSAKYTHAKMEDAKVALSRIRW